MNDAEKKEARLKFEKVICPKHSRPNHPVTISVTGLKTRKYLVVSLGAALLDKVGLKKGTLVCAYVNLERQLMLRVEDGPDARPIRSSGVGARLFAEFPYRPFGKLLPSHLYSTPADLFSAKKGELVITLPPVTPATRQEGKA